MINDDARNTLIEAVGALKRPISDDGLKRCCALLRDKCPGAMSEIHVLTLAARERQALVGDPSVGISLRINRLTELLAEKFGIDRKIGLWAAETWALAVGYATEGDVTFSVSCPRCGLQTRAAAHWKGRIAICPGCKSQISIEADGGTAIYQSCARDSASSRVTWWVLIDEAKPPTLEGVRLAEEIRRVLGDATLTDQEKAERIDLRRSLAVLPDIAGEVLKLSGPILDSFEALVLGVLRGADDEPGLLVLPELTEGQGAKFRDVVCTPASERVVGIIAGHCADEVTGVAFGSQGIYFRNSSNSSRPGCGSVLYAEFPRSDFSAAGLQEIQIRDNGILDLRGTGMSKRTMLRILKSIKHILTNVGWDGSEHRRT